MIDTVPMTGKVTLTVFLEVPERFRASPEVAKAYLEKEAGRPFDNDEPDSVRGVWMYDINSVEVTPTDMTCGITRVNKLQSAIALVLALHDHPQAWVPGYQVKLDPKAEAQLRAALE